MLIALLFSIVIEATQYFFRLSLCEFEDVFHNMLGTALGYDRLMSLLERKLRKPMGRILNKCRDVFVRFISI